MKKNFTDGPIFTPMLTFVIPIILTNILQTLYNIADNIVVGKFSGDVLALAAVGTSGSLSALFLNFVVGLAGGTSVIVSQAFGAGDHDRVSKSVHTAISFSALIGTAVGIVAIVFTEDMLVLTGVKEELLGRAALYLRIIFAALPATAVYNFSAAALRAVGDSRTSLIILTTSGLLNVILNVVFVLLFGMSVDGVALATAISKYVSAIWIIAVLIRRRRECYGVSLKKLRISLPILKSMLRLGFPNALQNSVFSISNVMITGAINSLETYVLSARTIAMNVTTLANNVSSSYTTALLTFSGQNYGAKKYQRLKRTVGIGVIQSFIVTLAVGLIALFFIEPISSLYVSSADPSRELIFEAARSIAVVTLPFYCVCSVMNALSGFLRGMGYSFSPMLVSLVGICGIRIAWIYTAFKLEALHSAQGLYISYPVSWVAVIIGHLFILTYAWRRIKNEPSYSKREVT